MRLARFAVNGVIASGKVEGNMVSALPGEPLSGSFALDAVRILAPCVPSKVVAVGLNYRDHARELNLPVPDEPLLFMKPATSVIGPGDRIVLPPRSSRVDYEAELAVVIAKTAKNVSRDNAREYILGYTCLNDVTARDLQQKDGQWTRAKSFDTFCPLGPWIETEIDPRNLGIELILSGTVRQRSRTSELLFDPWTLVEFITGVMTLLPGDVIATGTTSGIGPMQAGDTAEVRIEGIGSLLNPVWGEEA